MNEADEAAEWAALRRRRKYGVAAVLMGVASVLLFATLLMGRHGVEGAFGVSAVMSGPMAGMWLKERRSSVALAASSDALAESSDD